MGVANYGQMTARRLDVHRTPGHCPRHLQHPAKRRTASAWAFPRTSDLAGRLYVTSGLGGMSGAQAQGGRDRRRCGFGRRGGYAPGLRPVTARAGSSKVTDSLPEALAMAREKHGRQGAHAPSPTMATWWTCWSTCTTRTSTMDLLSDQTSCHDALRRRLLPRRASPLPSAPEMLARRPAGFPRTGGSHPWPHHYDADHEALMTEAPTSSTTATPS